MQKVRVSSYNVGGMFSVDETTLGFTISIDQDDKNWWH
jgi:hypothetical protein